MYNKDIKDVIMKNNKNTTYLLKLRKFEEKDINSECPYMLEEDSFYIHINAFIDDIKSLDGIVEILYTKTRNSIDIEIQTTLTVDELREGMRAYLSRDICYLRYVSLA